jgi:hypothetical protein
VPPIERNIETEKRAKNIPSELPPKLVPTSVVTKELLARQARATFNQARQFNSHSSALLVGQLVWAYVNSKWIHGTLHSSMCLNPFLQTGQENLRRRLFTSDN